MHNHLGKTSADLAANFKLTNHTAPVNMPQEEKKHDLPGTGRFDGARIADTFCN